LNAVIRAIERQQAPAPPTAPARHAARTATRSSPSSPTAPEPPEKSLTRPGSGVGLQIGHSGSWSATELWPKKRTDGPRLHRDRGREANPLRTAPRCP
jgi:hypothetical protein